MTSFPVAVSLKSSGGSSSSSAGVLVILQPAPGFQGNPNAAITAINTAGGIVASRTSGSTPAFVQVSASGITATGTSVPYEDLEYQWDFGDPSGTEIFTNPVTGVLDNANTAQWGPEAAYCYRSAGPYVITLKIRGKNGSSYTTTTATMTFTVTAFSPATDLYFDSVGGNDANAGTIGSPKQTMAAINAVFASAGTLDNIRVNLKRGSTWTGNGINHDTSTNSNHIRIQDYGAGALPKILLNSTTPGFVRTNGGASVASNTTDLVISNISFQTVAGWNSGSGDVINVGSGGSLTGQMTHFYFDNCEVINNIDPPAIKNIWDLTSGTTPASVGLVQKFGVWGGITSNPTNSLNWRQGFFISTSDWVFMYGLTISGAGTSVTFDHHIYPNVQRHMLFRWIKFGSAGSPPTRGFCINSNWDPVGTALPEIAQYWVVSDCELTGTGFAHDMSSGSPANDPTQTLFQNWVTQKCTIHDFPNGNIPFGQWGNQLSATFRDNKSWNNLEGTYFCVNGTQFGTNPNASAAVIIRYYRNKDYYPSNSAASNPVYFFNTLNVTYTNKHTFTDNIIQDMRANAVLITLDPTNQAGATIDRNQYYCPNAGSSFMSTSVQGAPPQPVDVGAITLKTFAQWQAFGFDANGNLNNPNWPDPAHGNFG